VAAAEDDFAPPQGLKERSTERWNNLVDRTKTAETQRDSLRTVLSDTGAPREDLAEHLLTLRLAYRGGPDGMRQALGRLDTLRANIAKQLGVEVPGVDLLSDFPDLAGEVENATMSRENAIAVANARRIAAANTANAQRQHQETTTQADFEQRATAARTRLDELGARLQSTDLDYDAKFKILKENGDFKDIMENFQPEKWGEQFERRYKLLGRVNVKPKPKTATQPLRATGTGGGGSPQPKSMLDAITQGITTEE